MNYQKPFLTALFEKSSNRIELNQCDKAGKSALYYAIELPDRADSVESTMFLIGKGADVNQICVICVYFIEINRFSLIKRRSSAR